MRLHCLFAMALSCTILTVCSPIAVHGQGVEPNAVTQEQGAQEEETQLEAPPPVDAPVTDVSETIAIPFGVMTSREFLLSGLILLFGLLVIGVQYFLLKSHAQRSPDEVTRPITVTLIIIGTLVLISSGFNNNQIAPAVGLFGTIAGYLLGRVQGRQDTRSGQEREGGS
jgi:hypothetical protein